MNALKPLPPPTARWPFALVLLGSLATVPAARAAEPAPDNGTDPTRLSTAAAVQYEHFDLKGGQSLGTWKLSYTQPFGEGRDYSLRLRVPIVRNPVLGNGDSGLGDVQVQLSHVFGVTPKGGIVVQGELSLDTADRPELGSGKQVFKGTVIYARFLPDGAIVAPALVHSRSLGGDARRSRVEVTTVDFYYVPRLADPKLFVTVDPALTRDWEARVGFASLAVTVGRAIGPAFGGSAQVFVKPTVFAGADRPSRWGLELGYKVIGF